MKFVHIADTHFDRPFINLSDKDILGDLRRMDQRKAFKKAIDYIKENNIEFLFISGDLYEQQYIKQSTIEYINNLFKEIPNTRIFISPGNHDPYIKNSYYNKFNWSENVKIFSSKIEKVSTDEANIYGYGFDDFYCRECGLENFEINDKQKLNILIMHATLDGSKTVEKPYNPISKQLLQSKGFDYIALGHIHKLSYNDEPNQNIVYPGSTVSLGFDELGEHGMIVGELNEEKKLKLEFLPLDEKEFKVTQLDVSEIYSKEELIEKINILEIPENIYLKVELIGNRNFEIDIYDIIKYLSNNQIIKIKDFTKLAYNLEKIQNENTLRGLFAEKMNEKLKSEELTEEQKNIIEKAIEIGFEALQ